MADLLPGSDGLARCAWSVATPLLQHYHDTEWGRPITGETAWLERIILEGFQAGLSWRTVLEKRARLAQVFHGFNADQVAAMTDQDLEAATQDPGIIRNRNKIWAARTNAQATLALRNLGGLEKLIRRHHPDPAPAASSWADVPTQSVESVNLARELKQAGFVFVGPTTMYALMQATAMVGSHLVGCHHFDSTIHTP